MRKLVLTIISVIALAACSSESQETLAEKIEDQVALKEDVCDYLKEEDIRAVYGLSDANKIRRNENFGICSLDWVKDPSKDARSNYYSLSMNFSTLNAKSKDEASKGFDLIISRMTGGMKISNQAIQEKAKEMGVDVDLSETLKKGVTLEGQTFSEVAGIGEKAMWSVKTSQLTVLQGREVFFVTVDCGVDKDEDLEKAKAMANKVVAML